MRSDLFLQRNLDDPNRVEMAGEIRSLALRTRGAGWAKRSVPTICERRVGWWARRFAPLPTAVRSADPFCRASGARLAIDAQLAARSRHRIEQRSTTSRMKRSACSSHESGPLRSSGRLKRSSAQMRVASQPDSDAFAAYRPAERTSRCANSNRPGIVRAKPSAGHQTGLLGHPEAAIGLGYLTATSIQRTARVPASVEAASLLDRSSATHRAEQRSSSGMPSRRGPCRWLPSYARRPRSAIHVDGWWARRFAPLPTLRNCSGPHYRPTAPWSA